MSPDHQEDEEDVCRVCRSGSEPGHPLFHPCKCAGSIRFVHQDCLMTWLQSSKRKYCELCGHSFSFTRVYDPTMPDALPPLLFAQRLARQLAKVVLLGLRSVLVGLTWLGLVPWLTIWTFRLYFVLGNGIAWTMTGQSRTPLLTNATTSTNASSHASDRLADALDIGIAVATGSLPSDASSAGRLLSGLAPFASAHGFLNHSAVVKIAKDTFEGQILTASIVISFLAAFLLREWTLQAPPREEPAQQEPAPPAAAPVADMQPNADVAAALAAIRAVELAAAHVEVARQPVGALLVDLGDGIQPPPFQGAPDEEAEVENGEAQTVQDEDEREDGPVNQEAVRRAREAYFASEGPEGPDSPKRIPSGRSPRAAHLRHLQKRRRVLDSESSSTDSSPAMSFGPLPPPSRDNRPEEASSSTDTRRARRSNRQPSPLTDQESLPDMERSSPPTFYTRESVPSTDDADESNVAGPSASGSSADSRPNGSPPTSSFTFRATASPPPSPPQPARRRPRPVGIYADREIPDVDRYPKREPLFGAPPRATASLAPRRRALSAEGVDTGVVGLQDRTFTRRYDPTSGDPRRGARPDVPVDVDENVPNEAQCEERQGGSATEALSKAVVGAEEDVEEEEEEEEEEDDEEEEEEEGMPPLVGGPARRVDLPLVRLEGNADGGEEGDEDQDDDHDGLRDDELEAANDRLLEEDLEGILEAIGIRGPVLQLLQNSALMTLVLSTCVALTIFVPFTLGKTLLLLNLLDLIRAARLPVKAVRFMTDPVLRISHQLGSRYLFPPLDAALLPLIQFLEGYLPAKAPARLDSDPLPDPSTVSAFLSSAQSHIRVGFAFVEDRIGRALTTDAASTSGPSPTWSRIVDKVPAAGLLSSAVAELGGEIGDLFALVGVAARDATDWVKMVFTGEVDSVGFASLAQGDTSADRFFAVWVGYSTVALALLMWFLMSSDTRGLSKTVKEVFKQNGVVVKLAFFMSIELIIFPLGCGILLDLCLLPLFHEAGLARAAFHLRAPFVSLFLHWVGGTLFMFGFASMLSHGRKQLRHGVFFFVRDPQDPTFQPVREIIDRGTGAQLVKIGASALMYFSVIAISVGLTLQTIRVLVPGTLPLHWKPNQPLSQIPIDLLALHFIGPPAIKFLRPHRRFRKLIEKWWSYSVVQLRLGNYFFASGADAPIDAEVDTPVRLALDKATRFLAKFTAKDAMRGFGGMVRVPNSDTLMLPSKKRVFILVTRSHEPIDQTEMDLLVEQNKKALADGRNPKEDFCVVYLPPFIRCRTFMLLFSLWVSLVVLVGASLAVPLVIGRYFFEVVLGKEVHDGYSFVAGSVIALCNFLASRSFLRKIRRWSQAERVRKTSLLGRIKRNILWGTNIAYLLVCFALVIPFALSFVVELYVVSPLKMGLSSTEPPVIFVWELWSMGLLWMHLLYTTRRYLSPSSFTRACDRVLFQVAHLQIAEITENLIGPVVGLCGALVVLPPLVGLAVHPLFGRAEQRATDIRLVYPALALAMLACLILQTLLTRLAAWRIKLRESEFLVELRLRNLDARGPHTIAAAPGADRQMTPGHLA